ncbi:hypothetical protein IQ255_13960 [Pleurocapsales cyanobacterium LEGE 10410]|nr:hypothetical protein [Pleurocapsales cyanobacterium LEGE 10410]
MMNIEEKRVVKMSFPFGQYFEQLFAADTYVRFINPFGFWRRYKIEHLETCRELDTVKHFENCHQLDLQSARSMNLGSNGSNEDYTGILNNILTEQSESNRIYISQPNIKLKYRGVSYYAKDVLSMNITVVQIDPASVQTNNFKQPNNSHNTSSPETLSNN